MDSRAARYTLAHQRVQRAKLVLYAEQGLTNVEFGERLDINRSQQELKNAQRSAEGP